MSFREALGLSEASVHPQLEIARSHLVASADPLSYRPGSARMLLTACIAICSRESLIWLRHTAVRWRCTWPRRRRNWNSSERALVHWQTCSRSGGCGVWADSSVP